MFVVAAEFMGASEGLGYLLVDGQQMGKPDRILAAIIAFALLGKAADACLVAVTRPLLAWQDVSRGRL
jgi:sulfonate transport system permease protein